ncbi:MAG: hypothetical protein AB1486_24090 [Planctomycetota bacterium]
MLVALLDARGGNVPHAVQFSDRVLELKCGERIAHGPAPELVLTGFAGAVLERAPAGPYRLAHQYLAGVWRYVSIPYDCLLELRGRSPEGRSIVKEIADRRAAGLEVSWP